MYYYYVKHYTRPVTHGVIVLAGTIKYLKLKTNIIPTTCRFANSLSYFGILFATPSLNGNQFLNLGLSGAVEIPALFVCMASMQL